MSDERTSKELIAALKDLCRAYVNTMENGRNRIIQLGGECDPVDVMERGDPYLRDAREAIAKAESTGHEPEEARLREQLAYWQNIATQPPDPEPLLAKVRAVREWANKYAVGSWSPHYQAAASTVLDLLDGATSTKEVR